MKIAIIGSGVAAFEAARTIRSLSGEAEITIYSREEVPPYRRPALSRMASEELAEAQFFLKPASFYAENRIALELGRPLRAIDPKTMTLHFASGAPADCDQLLLATGSRCFFPPVPGMELDGVLALREYADLQKLRARLDTGVKNVVVIGGGLLGLELAQSLLARGCAVTVVEGSPQLLPRNLDAEAAEVVLRQLAGVENLTLRFGCRVEAVARKAGRAVGVTLAEGGTLPADLVLVSAGVRSNLEVAAAAGIPCSRGIVTDRFLRTGVPGIYAAGDCAEVEGVSYGLFDAARSMGAAAAHNLLGEERPFVPQAYPARLAVFGVKLFSAGELAGARSESAPGAAGTFKKLFFDEKNRLVGAILVGDLREAVKLHARISDPPVSSN